MKNLHLIEINGKWHFVGSIPTKICKMVPANRSDVLAQRAFFHTDGKLYTWKCPVFDSYDEAVEHCRTNSVDLYYNNELVLHDRS